MNHELGFGVDSELNAVHCHSRPQPKRQPWCQVSPDSGLTQEQDVGQKLFTYLFHHRGIGIGLIIFEHGVINHIDLVRSEEDGFLGCIADAAAKKHCAQLLTQVVGELAPDA